MEEVTLEVIYKAIQALAEDSDGLDEKTKDDIHYILAHTEDISDQLVDIDEYINDIRTSISNIETLFTSSFVLLLICIISTIIIKTFFTGW